MPFLCLRPKGTWTLGRGTGRRSEDRSLRPEDSISQAGSPVSPARDSVEEQSYGNAVRSLSKIHPIPDIVGSLAPAAEPDSSRAVLQEQASTSGEGLVALRPSSSLEAVIRATDVALGGKEKPKKGDVPDYLGSALKTGVFLCLQPSAGSEGALRASARGNFAGGSYPECRGLALFH